MLGVPAAVHYLPAGKLCDCEGTGHYSEFAPSERERIRSHIAIGQDPDDGAFTFTFDSEGVPEERTLVIYAQYDTPEHGQPEEVVPSIAATWAEGDVEECKLVDGGIEGWPFQEGAVPGDK